jgi:exodeoxyribonuclease VII small subunit
MAGKRKGHRVSDATLPETFDETMRELRTVAEALEAGDGGLEDAVVLFERGVALQRHADTQLKAARLRVEELLPDGTTATLDLDEKD